jgi:hypothetical protein
VPLSPDTSGSQEAVEACAAAQIHDDFAGPQRSDGLWIATAEPEVCACWRVGDVLFGVPQQQAATALRAAAADTASILSFRDFGVGRAHLASDFVVVSGFHPSPPGYKDGDRSKKTQAFG